MRGVRRVGLVILAVSVWMLARFVSTAAPPAPIYVYFIGLTIIGSVVGGMLAGGRGALAGAGLGLTVGTLIIIPLDIVFFPPTI